jgi:purine nucleosidase
LSTFGAYDHCENEVSKIRKVIIDTDIGDDIDDALAIALALKSPEIELVGITTVYKNTELRKQLALKLLKIYGRSDIPAAAGIGMPLINRVDCTSVPCQFEAVEELIEDICSMNAVDFIIDSLRNNNNITIITIGALTNLAAAIIKEPEIMKKANLVMMGGIVTNPYPEGNINTDPEAARIVFESGMAITMVGLDVTLKCSMNEEHVRKLFESRDSRHQFLSRLIKIWNVKYLVPILRGWGMEIDEEKFQASPALHDVLAVGFLIGSTLFKTRPAKILVETRGEYTRGVTVESINVFNGKANGYNADVCIDVDAERFLELIIERIISC